MNLEGDNMIILDIIYNLNKLFTILVKNYKNVKTFKYYYLF